MAKDFKIEAISNNIFSKIDINKKENAKQWINDKESFEEELSKTINGLDNNQREVVLTKLEKLSQKPEGFLSSNGSIDIKKFIKTTKEIVSIEEDKLNSQNANNTNTFKEETENTKNTEEKIIEAKLKQIEQETEPYIKKWNDEEKKEYKRLVAETETKFEQIQKRKEELIKKNGIDPEKADEIAKNEFGWTRDNELVHNSVKKVHDARMAREAANENPDNAEAQKKAEIAEKEASESMEDVNRHVLKKNILKNKIAELNKQTKKPSSFEERKSLKMLGEASFEWGEDDEEHYIAIKKIMEEKKITEEEAIELFFGDPDKQMEQLIDEIILPRRNRANRYY